MRWTCAHDALRRRSLSSTTDPARSDTCSSCAEDVLTCERRPSATGCTVRVRRAACGVRRAACGVRRAACGVRRAACGGITHRFIWTGVLTRRVGPEAASRRWTSTDYDRHTELAPRPQSTP